MASTPCAACKLLRRKCTQECVFAPYFPPTQPQKFISVHKVFGASNVTKILNDLPPPNREDAVNSLYYEAEARIRDPIYGCVGPISFLQQCLKQIQQDLVAAKEELAGYIGHDAVIPQLPYIPPLSNNPPPNFMMTMEGMPHGVIPQGESLIIREPNLSQHQHQPQPQDEQMQLMAADAHRMASMILEGGDQQGMFNGYGIDNNGSVTATGYNQMDVNDHTAGVSFSGPSLALGSFGDAYQMSQETEHHISHDQLQTQLMLQPPLQESQEQNEGQFMMKPMGQENLHEEEGEDELEPPVKWRKSENKETSY